MCLRFAQFSIEVSCIFSVYDTTEIPNSTAFHYPMQPLSLFLNSIIIPVDEQNYDFVVVDKQIMVAYE
jgi:hypothetical protein